MFDNRTSVQVSRRIEAPAAQIFDILTNPQRHPDLDGSSEYTGEGKMLQGALSDDVITGVGDTFAMKMNFPEVGDYVMLNYVVEFEPNRRVGWEPAPGDEAASEDGRFPIGVPSGHRWSFQLVPDGPDATIVTEFYNDASAPEELREATHNGEDWISSMAMTLARLDEICAQRPNEGAR
jgi:uncharacterized protein YndB with AHSA1/START domain